MKLSHIAILFLTVLFCGCTAIVNLDPMFQDLDVYEEELRATAADPHTLEILDASLQKRAEAESLAVQGRKRDALPLVEKALADARLALAMNQMDASARRAEKCRLEVEKARTKWQEALYVLNQTVEFVGKEASVSKEEPESKQKQSQLPESALMTEAFPTATIAEVSRQWSEWRRAANGRSIASADLENSYRRSYDRTQAEKVEPATVQHHTYLAARTVQMLECRLHAIMYEQECEDATRLTSEYSDARAEVLRVTLDLERGLQDDLRRELEEVRAEAKSRQDELYNALSQMEGQFARIHRDARGTIVSLSDILFDFDKATLRRNVEFNLVKIATILNQFGEMKILIEGHTDSIGTEEYNLGLSKRRALAVQEFLISQDVDEGRLSSEGYGEGRPVADNSTEEGRQLNRRVDLVIQDAH
jgi:outer membrane protein OmpA-like peptidoglycan-associated protein